MPDCWQGLTSQCRYVRLATFVDLGARMLWREQQPLHPHQSAYFAQHILQRPPWSRLMGIKRVEIRHCDYGNQQQQDRIPANSAGKHRFIGQQLDISINGIFRHWMSNAEVM
jgi:hypothetical protein